MKRETGEKPVRARHCKLISENRGKQAPATGNGKAFSRNISEPGDLPAVLAASAHEYWKIAGKTLRNETVPPICRYYPGIKGSFQLVRPAERVFF